MKSPHILDLPTEFASAHPPQARREHGAVLVVGLLILLGMTQLVVSSMTTSITQEHLARNTQERVTMLNTSETLSNFAFQQNAWINKALNYVDATEFTTWPIYTFSDANVVGKQVADQYDMEIEIQAQRNLATGMSVGNGASTMTVQMSIRSQSTLKTNPSVTTTTVHGWQLLAAG